MNFNEGLLQKNCQQMKAQMAQFEQSNNNNGLVQ